MTRLYNGTTQVLRHGAAVVTAPPLTMAAWAFSTNSTATQRVIQMGQATTINHRYTLTLAGAAAGDPVQCAVKDTVAAIASTTTGYAVNRWHHVVGVFTSASSRTVTIDGGSSGTETTTINPDPALMTRTSIASVDDSTGPTLGIIGMVAESAIWTAALTVSEKVILANGECPMLIRPESLAMYLIDSDQGFSVDVVSGRIFTAIASPVIVDGRPPLNQPDPEQIPPAFRAVAQALDSARFGPRIWSPVGMLMPQAVM